MTELIFTAGFVLIAAVLLCACSDKLDIRQAYEFDLATLPVQTDIVQGEEAEIRCQLVRSGRYEETEYLIPSGSITGRSAPTSRRLTSTSWIHLVRR